jgi:hypothetical protein
VIQIVAKLRRVAAFTAALALLSVASPGPTNAQSPPPAPPAPPAADTTAKPAVADTTAKPAAQSAPGVGAQSAPAPTATSTAAPQGKSGKGSKPPKTPKTSKPKTPKAPKAAAAAAVAKPYEERRKLDGVYAKGASWLSLRFGYANRTGALSGDGAVGYGMSYTRLLSTRYAFSAGINHDVVGHFANQVDEAVPFTAEFQRIFKWSGEMRPYLGVGGGFYFRKFYRTGSEYNTTTTGGGHVSIGVTSQLDAKHVVGLETRVAWLQGRPGVTNPTFGPGEDTETIWTVKLTWALVY